MVYSDCVIVRQVPGCRFALIRRLGKGLDFFIANPDKIEGVVPMIPLYLVSRNYFKCRSVAVAMYLAFADSVKRVGGASRG